MKNKNKKSNKCEKNRKKIKKIGRGEDWGNRIEVKGKARREIKIIEKEKKHTRKGDRKWK